MNLGQDYSLAQPVVDGNLLKTVNIFAIPFGNTRGTEITLAFKSKTTIL